jgi:hypothetical protein
MPVLSTLNAPPGSSAMSLSYALPANASVETILLEPDGERLNISLKGDLAGMLSAARDSKRSPDTGDLMVQIKLVAGAVTCHWRRWRHDPGLRDVAA